MLSNFSLYYNCSSKIHSLNPLCKILAFLIFSFMSFMCFHFNVLVSLFLVLVFIVGISNIPFSVYFKRIWSLKYLFLVLFLLCFVLSRNFSFSFFLVCKLVLFVLYVLGFVMTTKIDDMALGFSYLFRFVDVFGFSAYSVAVSFSLIFYFLPCLVFEYKRIKMACVSRGVSFNGSVFALFKLAFLSSIKRLDMIRCSMLVSSSIRGFRWHFNDIYMIVCHLAVLVLILVRGVTL